MSYDCSISAFCTNVRKKAIMNSFIGFKFKLSYYDINTLRLFLSPVLSVRCTILKEALKDQTPRGTTSTCCRVCIHIIHNSLWVFFCVRFLYICGGSRSTAFNLNGEIIVIRWCYYMWLLSYDNCREA